MTVVDVGGTVIFTIRTVSELPKPLLRLDPATESAEIPVEISASRCDAHALTESKKSFVFPMWVSLGEAPEQYLEIEPEGDSRRLLEQLLDECRPAG
ncbi:MAG: hypothetical protein GEU81_07230 [Nitriliruptorales bacterium]|nr:hypothetical protein [Nitriliruptorales bacterium]